jgi:hypothetical protein
MIDEMWCSQAQAAIIARQQAEQTSAKAERDERAALLGSAHAPPHISTQQRASMPLSLSLIIIVHNHSYSYNRFCG